MPFCIQGGEPKYREAWAQLCDISRKEFDKVYQRLGVHLEEKVDTRISLYNNNNEMITFVNININCFRKPWNFPNKI